MELIPHLSYWKQLPGLVKDGCVFSRGQSCKAYAWACERYAARRGYDPLKASLKGDEGASAAAET